MHRRPYALDIFPNLRGVIDKKKLASLLREEGWMNELRRKIFYKTCTVVIQNGMQHAVIPTKPGLNLLLKGFFQSERYFKDVREELLNDFAFPEMDSQNLEIKKKITDTPGSVSIHIRRGDYLSPLNKDVFTSVNLDYYYRSLEILQNKSEAQQLTAFVFTDDTDWAKQNFSPAGMNIQFITGNAVADSWKDMALMTTCKHHIIANSSFSWWGAWLSENDGITLAPKHWYLPGSYTFHINDIVPSNWIIVDYSLKQEKKYDPVIAQAI
jgi:hypothetical protein